MSAWPAACTLATNEGELVLIRVSVEPRLLEDLLETLAELPFPINPQIYHEVRTTQKTSVEFPAYGSWTGSIRSALATAGLAAQLSVHPMLEELRMAS